MPPLEGQERILKPALITSLFPNVSPTIYFGTRDERGKGPDWYRNRHDQCKCAKGGGVEFQGGDKRQWHE